ncbi:MAG TPA: GntR family transcriptional regulator [Candidatus Limnocylindrales bacterium]
MRSDRIPRQGLWQQVAARLRQEISKGRLAPGTRLVEGELADRFGVSRGPVREALRDLARSGLVVGLPHRGVFVCTPSDADLEEIFLLREALEQAASRLAITKLLPDDCDHLRGLLNSMETARKAGDSAARKASDLRFHREIFVIADSARLLRAHDDLVAEMLLAKTSGLPNWNDDVYPPAELHERIFDSLVAGDENGLFTALQAHYGWTGDRLFGDAGDVSPESRTPARPRSVARRSRPRRVPGEVSAVSAQAPKRSLRGVARAKS